MKLGSNSPTTAATAASIPGLDCRTSWRQPIYGWQNHASGTTYQTGQWYHMVGQIDDTSDTVRLYVDEMLVFETTDTEEVELDTGNLFIRWAENELGIDGRIDEVAVWTRILSEAEIPALY